MLLLLVDDNSLKSGLRKLRIIVVCLTWLRTQSA
jgi:hypothetical protein